MESYNRSSTINVYINTHITFQTLLNIAGVMFAGIFLHSNLFPLLHAPKPHITYAIRPCRCEDICDPTRIFYWCSVQYLAMDIRTTTDRLTSVVVTQQRQVRQAYYSSFPRYVTRLSVHVPNGPFQDLSPQLCTCFPTDDTIPGNSAGNLVIYTLDSKWAAQKLIWSNIQH